MEKSDLDKMYETIKQGIENQKGFVLLPHVNGFAVYEMDAETLKAFLGLHSWTNN